MADNLSVRQGSVPPGYSYVRKGNVYITGTCRKKTEAAGQNVYIVIARSKGKDKQVGIAVPSAIYTQVQEMEAETRAARATNVARRDNSIKNSFEQVISDVFPHMPPVDLQKVLERALLKGSGRVGRNGQLDDREKAHLAVRAHIRHCHTNYDEIMKGVHRGGKDSAQLKADARNAISNQVAALAGKWMGPESVMRERERRKRKSSSSTKASSSAASRSSATAKSRSKKKKKKKRKGSWPSAASGTSAAAKRQEQAVAPAQPAFRTRAFVLRAKAAQLEQLQPDVEVIDLTMTDDDSNDETKDKSIDEYSDVEYRYDEYMDEDYMDDEYSDDEDD